MKKFKYKVLKSVLSPEILDYTYSYFTLKERATKFLFENKIISPFFKLFGYYGDQQIPNTYNSYGDPLAETILTKLKSKIEKVYGKSLIETYAYTRLYKNGDELKRHIDRKSCELSATLNIGGDPWPIHIDLTGGRNKAGTKIDLKPGDLLVYKGCEHEHWREVFKGKKCLQIFLHYNPKRGKNSQKYDGRPFLGIPDFDL